jgi:hypothetical protein
LTNVRNVEILGMCKGNPKKKKINLGRYACSLAKMSRFEIQSIYLNYFEVDKKCYWRLLASYKVDTISFIAYFKGETFETDLKESLKRKLFKHLHINFISQPLIHQ